MNEKKKQSPERLEYLRNYRKNHKEQQKIYQRRYIEKLRQQGKFPITTSMKLRKQLVAYENMRKEAIEYIKNNQTPISEPSTTLMKLYGKCLFEKHCEDLLKILNKVGGSDE